MIKRKPAELKLKVPWGHVAALAWGDPRGQPVLMLHGNMDNADSFILLIQLLPENYYYVSIDLPGHGLSSHFPAGIPLDVVQYALMIYYVLAELKWTKCYCIAHSAGSMMGVLFSTIFPDRFEKIVAFDIISGYNIKPEMLAERLRTVCRGTIKSTKSKEVRLYTKEEIMDALEYRRLYKLNREAVEAMFERATTKIGDKYVYNKDDRLSTYVMPYFTFEQNAALFEEQAAPILLISPTRSFYHLSQQSETLDLIKEKFTHKITVVTIDGDHDIHNNRPEIVAPYVINFLSGQKSKL